MKNDIRLSDGTLLNININFLTMKIIVDLDIEKLFEKQQKKPNDKKLQMDIAGKLIYAIIRSNGKKVDMDEALILVPMDDQLIFRLFEQFGEKMESFKKKQVNAM